MDSGEGVERCGSAGLSTESPVTGRPPRESEREGGRRKITGGATLSVRERERQPHARARARSRPLLGRAAGPSARTSGPFAGPDRRERKQPGSDFVFVFLFQINE
jgi:hypothetical protein